MLTRINVQPSHQAYEKRAPLPHIHVFLEHQCTIEASLFRDTTTTCESSSTDWVIIYRHWTGDIFVLLFFISYPSCGGLDMGLTLGVQASNNPLKGCYTASCRLQLTPLSDTTPCSCWRQVSICLFTEAPYCHHVSAVFAHGRVAACWLPKKKCQHTRFLTLTF